MLTPAQRVLRFARFTLNPNTASLSCDGREIRLRHKSFDVLLYLTRNAARVVTKDELIEAVWPDTFVTDNSLVQCISDIRVALNDDEQEILKTVARRGYLFAAPVTEVERPSGGQIAPTSEQAGSDHSMGQIPAESVPDHHLTVGKIRGWPLPLYVLVIVGGLTILAAAGAAWWWSGRPGSEVASRSSVNTPELPRDLPRASIAVLPFDNLAGYSEGMDLGDALAENIISSLSKTPKMFVIARNSAFTYKGKPVKVQTVSRELGVRYVLEGSVQRSRSRVRITAQLIDATSGFHLWSETYDRDLHDVFALQDEIALSVVTALQITLTQGEVARIRQRGTNNLRAWLLVNQSFEHLVRFTKEDNEQARKLAEEAIALDPNYPEAYVRLGRTHLTDFHAGWVANPSASLGLSIELAQQALKLDDTYPDAYHLLSAIYLYLKRHDDARLAVAKALNLSPNHSLAKASLGMILTYAGEPGPAINVFKEAMRLSPIYPNWFLSELARAYFLIGSYEEAIKVLQERLQHDPHSGEALILLTASESAAGRPDNAKVALDKFLAPRPAYTLRHYASGEFFKNPGDLNRVLEALRNAGLPE
jgi:TolB-like protein/DNA-binding winged helix-turn-helix (wHTH) protein